MTNTEAIDKVEAWLLQQEERCVTTLGQCTYWRPGGNMCAIGALLGPELAQKVAMSRLSGFSVTRILTRANGALALAAHEALRGVSVKLLQDLQILHDAETRGPKLAQELWRLREKYATEA